jgi:hypothetical protein
MKQRNETATQPGLDDQPWLVSRGTHMTTKQSQANKEQENGITDLLLGFDERGVATFEVDIPVSEQYATVYRKRLLSPEHELAIAILDEAIADFQDTSPSATPKVRSASLRLRRGSSTRIRTGPSRSKTSVRCWDSILGTYVKGSCVGSKRNYQSRVLLNRRDQS